MDDSGSSSESGQGQDFHDQSKVAYVAQACIFCKKRHLKCDGMTPCVQCHLRTQDCIYEGSKKRGRKPTNESKKPAGAGFSSSGSAAVNKAPANPPATPRTSQNTTSTNKRTHSQTNQPSQAPPPKRAKLTATNEPAANAVLSRSNPKIPPPDMETPEMKHKTENQTRRAASSSVSSKMSTASSTSSSSSSGVSSPADDTSLLSRDALIALVERQRSALNELTSAQGHFANLSGSIASEMKFSSSKSRRKSSNNMSSSGQDKDIRTTVDESSDSGGFDDGIHVNSNSSNSSDENGSLDSKRRRRVLYADPGIAASSLMTVFINRNSFLFPTGKPPVDAGSASAYFNSFKSKEAFKRLLKSDINTLTEAFSYGVAFALGAKAIARWSLVKDFIFHTNNKLLEKILKKDLGTQPNASLYLVRVLSGVCFHIMLHVACGDIPEARNCAFLAFNLMNQYQNMVIKTLQYTVYTHMASLCTRPQEKLHFLDCAEKLGQGSAPPVNQVILAVFVTGEILSKTDQLFDMEHFTEKTSAQEFEYRLKLHQYCAAALDSIDHHPAFSHGRNVLMAATLKMMVSGCRALAALQIGKHDEALAWTATTIQVVKYVDTTILPMLITVSLAYAVHVAVVMQQRDLFCMGMARLKQFTGLYPIAVRLWNRLVAQGQQLASDATFIVALPEYGTPAFAQYQQQIQHAAQLTPTSTSSTPGSSSSGAVNSSGNNSTSPSDNTPSGSSPSATGSSSTSNSGSGQGTGTGSSLSPSLNLAGPSMFATSFPLTPLGMGAPLSAPGSGSSSSGSSNPSPPSTFTPTNSSNGVGFDSAGLGYGMPNSNGGYSSYGMLGDMYPGIHGMMPQTHQHLHMHQTSPHQLHPSTMGAMSGFSPQGMSSFNLTPVSQQQQADLMDNNMGIKSSSPEFQSSFDDAGVM